MYFFFIFHAFMSLQVYSIVLEIMYILHVYNIHVAIDIIVTSSANKDLVADEIS